MPYSIKKVKGGYKVIKKDTGAIVAGKKKPLSMAGAKGYIYHASKGE